MAGFRLAIDSLSPPFVHRKDFIQEYLLARSVAAGANPYLPLPQLSAQFNVGAPHEIFPHPAPYPPPLALFSLPLALLNYERAAAAWLIFELFCLLASTALLVGWMRPKAALSAALLAAWAALGWAHVWEELVTGQVNALLLLLLALAWRALRGEKQIAGGILLGTVIALKIIAWPLTLFLLVRRKLAGATAAVATFATANLLAGALMGWAAVIEYYVRVGPAVMSLYRAHIRNLSLWGVGWRLFSGTGSPVLAGIQAPPLIHAPSVASLMGYCLPVVTLAICLWLTAKMKSFDSGYGLMICVSLLISPLLWSHYLIILAIPAVILARLLYDSKFPKAERKMAMIAGLLLLVPSAALLKIVSGFTVEGGETEYATVPFAATLFSLIPTIAALLCVVLIYRLSRLVDQARSQKDSGNLDG